MLLGELGSKHRGHAEQGVVVDHHGVRLGVRKGDLAHGDVERERPFDRFGICERRGVVCGGLLYECFALEVARHDGLDDRAVHVVGYSIGGAAAGWGEDHMGSQRGFVLRCGCGGCICVIALFEGCFLAVVDSFDQVRAFDRALLEQIARLLFACDGMQRDEGSSASASVSTTVENGDAFQESSATTATSIASMEVFARMGSNMKLKTVARMMGKMSVHTTALGVSKSLRTVVLKVVHIFAPSRAARGRDLEEHVVQGGRGARDAAQSRLARA